MAAPPIDEVASGEVPDVEDDPYQVYMLRRPAERASSVIPQLPKQPEMADTRLRYRRIPPESRSGSFGSFGNHFPPRFEFPNRRSLLESLTSDDEPSSFAVRRRRRSIDKSAKKKKKKRPTRSALASAPALSPASPAKPPLPAKLPPIAIAPAPTHDHPPTAHPASDSSTPLSTSPTTPIPGSPIDQGNLTLPAAPNLPDDLAEAAALRLAAEAHVPPHRPADAAVAGSSDGARDGVREYLPRAASPSVVEVAGPSTRRTLSPRKARAAEGAAPFSTTRRTLSPKKAKVADGSAGSPGPRRTLSPKKGKVAEGSSGAPSTARRTLSPKKTTGDGSRAPAEAESGRTGRDKVTRMDSNKATRMDSNKARRLDSGRSGASRRKDGRGKAGKGGRRDSPSGQGAARVGLTTAVDGRPISAPAAMSPAMREKFVLYAEEPVAYNSRGEGGGQDRGRAGEKRERGKKGGEGEAVAKTGRARGVAPVAVARGFEEEAKRVDAFGRDKELSVSFVHRRYTAEEAAARPLNAIQRLWQVLAFARLPGSRRARRRT